MPKVKIHVIGPEIPPLDFSYQTPEEADGRAREAQARYDSARDMALKVDRLIEAGDLKEALRIAWTCIKVILDDHQYDKERIGSLQL